MKFVRAESLRQVSELLVQEAGIARTLAGGPDVLVQNRPGLVEPDIVIDVKFLEAEVQAE